MAESEPPAHAVARSPFNGQQTRVSVAEERELRLIFSFSVTAESSVNCPLRSIAVPTRRVAHRIGPAEP